MNHLPKHGFGRTVYGGTIEEPLKSPYSKRSAWRPSLSTVRRTGNPDNGPMYIARCDRWKRLAGKTLKQMSLEWLQAAADEAPERWHSRVEVLEGISLEMGRHIPINAGFWGLNRLWAEGNISKAKRRAWHPVEALGGASLWYWRAKT